MNNLIKVIAGFLMLFFAGNAYAQSSKNALSFEFTPSFGYRFLVADDKGNFQYRGARRGPENTKKIWDTAESAVFSYAAEIKFIRRLNNRLSASAGLGFIEMGKKYTELEPDFYMAPDGSIIPIYSNKTVDFYSRIQYLSVPLAMQYNKELNEKFGLTASVGLTPMYAIGWNLRFSNNVVFSGPPNQNKNASNYFLTVNRFVLSSEIAVGLSYKLNEKLEFQVLPSYLQQLTKGVTYWDDLHQYNYNLGLKFGTKVNL